MTQFEMLQSKITSRRKCEIFLKIYLFLLEYSEAKISKKLHCARVNNKGFMIQCKNKRYERKSQPKLVIISPLHLRNVKTQIQEAGRESRWAWSIRIHGTEWAWPSCSYSPPLGPVILARHAAQQGDRSPEKAGNGGRGCMKTRGRGQAHLH